MWGKADARWTWVWVGWRRDRDRWQSWDIAVRTKINSGIQVSEKEIRYPEDHSPGSYPCQTPPHDIRPCTTPGSPAGVCLPNAGHQQLYRTKSRHKLLHQSRRRAFPTRRRRHSSLGSDKTNDGRTVVNIDSKTQTFDHNAGNDQPRVDEEVYGSKNPRKVERHLRFPALPRPPVRDVDVKGAALVLPSEVKGRQSSGHGLKAYTKGRCTRRKL